MNLLDNKENIVQETTRDTETVFNQFKKYNI